MPRRVKEKTPSYPGKIEVVAFCGVVHYSLSWCIGMAEHGQKKQTRKAEAGE